MMCGDDDDNLSYFVSFDEKKFSVRVALLVTKEYSLSISLINKNLLGLSCCLSS